MSPTELDQLLCFALYRASKVMTAQYRPLLERLGLTYPQYLVMVVLWEEGQASVSHLGDRLGLDSGTLSPLLKRLEARQLVVRSRSVGDERRVDVRLAPAGVAMKEEALCIPAQLLSSVDTSGYDLDDLRRTLQSLVADIHSNQRSRSESKGNSHGRSLHS